MLGENRVNAMDYQGAVDAFEQSLEVNPHSAAAHFELACLFDEKISDPAAAIYHYQQYLKFEAKSRKRRSRQLRASRLANSSSPPT